MSDKPDSASERPYLSSTFSEREAAEAEELVARLNGGGDESLPELIALCCERDGQSMPLAPAGFADLLMRIAHKRHAKALIKAYQAALRSRMKRLGREPKDAKAVRDQGVDCFWAVWEAGDEARDASAKLAKWEGKFLRLD